MWSTKLQALGPFEIRALCHCTGHTFVKLALHLSQSGGRTRISALVPEHKMAVATLSVRTLGGSSWKE